MKHFCLFFTVIYLLGQTCHGKGIAQINIIFINNLVEPNENQVETLISLASFPFLKASNHSLMTSFGLVSNYTMIFSVEPDNIITLPGLDVDKYTSNFFRHVITNFTEQSCRGASLQAANKALEISSSPSLIFMAVNRRPKGIALMMEILEKMVAKMNPILIFQINEDGTVYTPPMKPFDVNLEQLIPKEKAASDNKSLALEYSSIMSVSENIMYLMGLQAAIQEMRGFKIHTMVPELSKISKNFATSSVQRSVVFVYDVINATDQELDQIARSMESQYRSRNDSYRMTYKYFAIFSSNPNDVLPIDPNSNYTAYDFKTLIYTQTTDGFGGPTLNRSTLRSLRRALRIIPTFSRISYYVSDVPNNEYTVFTQILQLVKEKAIDINIQGYGNLAHSKRLPVLYRTIKDASRMASGDATLTGSLTKIILLFAIIFNDDLSHRLLD